MRIKKKMRVTDVCGFFDLDEKLPVDYCSYKYYS